MSTWRTALSNRSNSVLPGTFGAGSGFTSALWHNGENKTQKRGEELNAAFRWLFRTPVRIFGTIVWGSLLLFFPVNFAAKRLLSYLSYEQFRHVMLVCAPWWEMLFTLYILCLFGSMAVTAFHKRRTERREEKAAANENFLNQVEGEAARIKMPKVGDIHPKFNLLAFSGYDSETGEECWASTAIEGPAAAFAAFRENKRVHSPSNHRTCSSRDGDNQPALSSPMSHPHSRP